MYEKQCKYVNEPQCMTNLREKGSKNDAYQIVHAEILNPKCIKMGELYGEYNLLTKDEIKAIEKEQHKKVDAAVEFAKSAPEPPLREMTSDIYSGEKVVPRMCVL